MGEAEGTRKDLSGSQRGLGAGLMMSRSVSQKFLHRTRTVTPSRSRPRSRNLEMKKNFSLPIMMFPS